MQRQPIDYTVNLHQLDLALLLEGIKNVLCHIIFFQIGSYFRELKVLEIFCIYCPLKSLSLSVTSHNKRRRCDRHRLTDMKLQAVKMVWKNRNPWIYTEKSLFSKLTPSQKRMYLIKTAEAMSPFLIGHVNG